MTDGSNIVTIRDIDVPFWRIVMILIKWSIAAIPAMIIVGILYASICLLAWRSACRHPTSADASSPDRNRKRRSQAGTSTLYNGGGQLRVRHMNVMDRSVLARPIRKPKQQANCSPRQARRRSPSASRVRLIAAAAPITVWATTLCGDCGGLPVPLPHAARLSA